jgi:hypothetical protein
MAREVKLTLTLNPGARIETMQATFEDDEWGRLADFLAYAKQMEETELLRNGFPGLSLSFKSENGGTTITSKLPPEDQISAVLHRLRPFVLEGERTNFHAICNILSRRFESDLMRRAVSAMKELYSGGYNQRLYTLTAGNMTINSEEFLLKWLNAYEYHRDKDKRAELAEIATILPPCHQGCACIANSRQGAGDRSCRTHDSPNGRRRRLTDLKANVNARRSPATLRQWEQ